jgi:hypothetical protein
MLNKYAGRLRRFQVICDRQLAELTAKLEARAGQEEVQVLAERYVRRGRLTWGYRYTALVGGGQSTVNSFNCKY